MRSLYWLTAITLIAAAITTVAIADYGRRHPGSFFWQENAAKSHAMECIATDAPPIPCQMSPSQCSPANPVVLSVPAPGQPSACPACDNQAVPFVSLNTPTIPSYEEPPEHKQLREQTMQRLTMMQERAPAVIPPIPAAPLPVSDEFSFPGNKPPPAQLASPVTKSDFAALPTVSPSQSQAPLPDAFESQAQGAEVLPGLHAAQPAKPAQDDFANPIQECLQAAAELVTLTAVPVHLTALPPKPVVTNVATTKTGECCKPNPTLALSTNALATCPVCLEPTRLPEGQAVQCNPAKSCCQDGKHSEEVIVRTYSISDFPIEKGSTQEELTRLITTMVAPDSWMTRDSNIEYFAPGKCLVVRHRASVHEQIDDLICQLRAAVQKQSGFNFSVRLAIPAPVVHHEKTDCMPVSFELVPLAPQESPLRFPRVFTDEPQQCFDDEFFGLAPMGPDGRLMPIRAYSSGVTDSSLLPTGFSPVPAPTLRFFGEGPAGKNDDQAPPGFFPMSLPFAPLPLGSDKNAPNKK
jgi:hypothetical protein